MEIKLNMVFKTTTNNKMAKVIKVGENGLTAILKFEDDSTKTYSIGTLKDKRRFIPVEEEDDSDYIQEIMEQKKELGIECPEIKSYEIVKETKLVPMPGAEKLVNLKESGKKPRISITYNGKTQSPGDWAKEFGMDPKRIRLALRKGKSPEEIFNGKNQ